MKKTAKSSLAAVFSVAVLVLLDQGTKALAVSRLMEGPFVILDGIFELRYTVNRGAAFGILQQRQILFFILTIAIVVLIAWAYLFRIPSERKFLPLNLLCVFITAGALGNFIDRLRQGYVVDFLYFKLIDFPVFNIADCYVTVSAFLLIFLFLFYYREEDLEGIL